MMLTANNIIFIHPITKEKINIDIGIPDEYWSVFKNEK